MHFKDLDKISSHNERVLPRERARYIQVMFNSLIAPGKKTVFELICSTFKTPVLSATGKRVKKSQTEWEGSAIIFLALQRNLVLAVSSGEGRGQSTMVVFLHPLAHF